MFLTYLKSLGGSNIVKVVPANGNANPSGDEQANGHKRLKVVCGTNTSYLDDLTWVGEKTPATLCNVRVSPINTVKPNLGALELSEALSRVLPFTFQEDTKPVLQCVLFKVSEGKLTMVSADGFRLAVVKLDFDGDEGQVLINHDELKGVISALRKAHRARIGFEKSKRSSDTLSLILDTELIRYKWRSAEGNYPDYQKLIPAEFITITNFDTNEALKAVNSLKVLSDSKAYPIDLTIGKSKVILSNPDDKGQTVIPADTQGEDRVRLDGGYLVEALRACGGMVELKLTDSKSPMLFTTPDYELVVMPMLTSENPKPEDKAEQPEAKSAEATEPETETAEAVAEAESITKAEKPKRKHKVKEPVAV